MLVAVVAPIIVKLIIAVIVVIIIYVIYAKVTGTSIMPDIGKALDGTPMICPPDYPVSNGAGICYKKCDPGHTWDKLDGCYPGCAPGTEQSLVACNKNRIFSSVGVTDTLPNQCVGDPGADKHWEMNGGLCYKVPNGYKMTSPGFMQKICPKDYSSTGVTCFRPDSRYPAGASVLATCPAGYYNNGTQCWRNPTWDNPVGFGNGWNGATCPKDMFLGLLGRCYTKCALGYKNDGTSCVRFADTLSTGYGPISITGTLPNGCPAGKELHGRLCYPACPAGTIRNPADIEYCSSPCPKGTVDMGVMGCTRKRYTIGSAALTAVGTCPPGRVKKGLLCYRT